MIQSLTQINTALVRLSHQLSNKQTSLQVIRNSINSLVEQVKFLDEKQRYNYYMLISQIYATRFLNIQSATNELNQFSKTLHSQISMNCQLRMAFFIYFQFNYKQAFRHLDLALGQVQEELKLVHNAKFFFNRVLNQDYLIMESKDKLNFESGFILSLIYQHQKEYIDALKLIETFLEHSKDPFTQFQIYKKLLQIYQLMKVHNVSTISVSKKSIETYRQHLLNLQTTYPQFQDNYHYKIKFITRVINFIQSEQPQTNPKLQKKMLDYKFLAYCKLKKCSKQAPTKQIKTALLDTVKLIRASKQTQLLQNILNYDFIKQQYHIWKNFSSTINNLYNTIFFSALRKYQPDTIIQPSNKQFFKGSESLMFKKTSFNNIPQKIQFNSKHQAPNSISSTSKYVSKQEQPRLFSFGQTQNMNSSALKNTSQMIKQPIEANMQIQQTQSEILNIDNFQGSNMYKFNATSSGHEERYFYIIPEKIDDKPKLYYCLNKKNKSSSDSSYPLKGLKKLLIGKKTDALKRKEAQKFSDSQCFALIFDDGKDKSFYVPNQDDFQKWVILLQTRVLYTDSNIDKMTKTMGFKPQQSMKNMNKTSPPKKPKRVFDI